MEGYGYVDLKNWPSQYETDKLDFSDRGDNLGDSGLSGTKGVCPTNRTRRTNVDIWASIWPNPYPEGKVHKSLVVLICTIVDKSTTMEEIYSMVTECGVTDECDALQTSRAIWTFRDRCREAAQEG